MPKRASRVSPSRARLESAKQRLIAESGDRPWIMGLGIGKVEGKLGLIVSVKPSAKPTAARVINRLRLDVPIEIRGVEEIRARRSSGRKRSASQKRVEALRQLAAKRLG
jgi:hypothetical protein